MFTKKDLLDCATKKFGWIFDEQNNTVSFGEGEKVSADIVVKVLREDIGQSFECIYSEHVSLVSVLKCTKCGTIIFSRDDEEHEPNLRCPTCTNYHTHFEYWAKEQIDSDKEKQEAIGFYLHMKEAQRKEEERYVKRGNLYDFQKTHKACLFKGKKWIVDIQLTGYVKWDLQAEVNVWKNHTCKHHIDIPISPYTMWFFLKHKVKPVVTWKNV